MFRSNRDDTWGSSEFSDLSVLMWECGTEASGIVLLEAWSAGKPVVSTVNGDPAEFVWHEVNGLKVYAHPESITWGLGTLFTFEWARWIQWRSFFTSCSSRSISSIFRSASIRESPVFSS